MELLLTLAGLYALQCVLLLPRGAVLFVRPLRSWRRSEGPGWHLTHPLPSARSWVGLRLPLVEDESGLRSRGVTPWFGTAMASSPGPHLQLGGGQEVEVRGAVVRVGARPFVRGADNGHAAFLGGLIDALAHQEKTAWSRLEDELASCCSSEKARLGQLRLEEATRWLRPLSDASFLALFVVLPVLVLWVHPEWALLLFLPTYGALHVATVVALVLAHRRLFPDDMGERIEHIIGAAFYPPLLLRAVQNLRMAVLGPFHPAAVATVTLPRDVALDFLRSELARLQHQSGTRERGRSLAGIEETLLSELAIELDTTAEALLAPPERRDALARSYCPMCLGEYRLASGECSDCSVPLQAFAS